MGKVTKTKLKNLRTAAGYTQKALAITTGVTTTAYQRYEYAERVPDVRIAIRIARALHTTVENIWGSTLKH